MDFLGIGLPELIAIIALAVIFIGPRDLPKMAGRAAKSLRDLRMMTDGFMTEWQRELNAASRIEGLEELKTLKDEYEQAKQSVQSLGTSLTTVDKETSDQIEQVKQDLDAIKSTGKPGPQPTASPSQLAAQQKAKTSPPAQTIAPPGTTAAPQPTKDTLNGDHGPEPGSDRSTD